MVLYRGFANYMTLEPHLVLMAKSPSFISQTFDPLFPSMNYLLKVFHSCLILGELLYNYIIVIPWATMYLLI